MTHKERIAAIQKKISGVKSLYGITQWETDRMNEWEKAESLTVNQAGVLFQIERKVFK